MLNMYLEVSHHDQAHGVGAARHQSAGVDPTLVAVFNDLGVAQEAHHHHCRTHTQLQRIKTQERKILHNRIINLCFLKKTESRWNI